MFYIYFGTTLLYVLPVEWQSCLHNPHRGSALWGPASQMANGEYKVLHPRFFFSASAPPVEWDSDRGGAQHMFEFH